MGFATVFANVIVHGFCDFFMVVCGWFNGFVFPVRELQLPAAVRADSFAHQVVINIEFQIALYLSPEPAGSVRTTTFR